MNAGLSASLWGPIELSGFWAPAATSMTMMNVTINDVVINIINAELKLLSITVLRAYCFFDVLKMACYFFLYCIAVVWRTLKAALINTSS